MSTIEQAFSFADEEVRVLGSIEAPEFVAADVARILGYRMASDMTRSLDAEDKGTRPVRTPSGEQEVTIITEAGLYQCIMQRQTGRMSAEQAAWVRRFQQWVTREVLPEIRRTGSYNAAPAIPDLSTPEGVLALAQTLTKTAEELVAAKNEVAELTPRADAWDELASAEGDYEVADAAKILARAGIETGRQRLFTQLSDMGWIYRGPQGKWKARQTAVDAGYLAEKPQSHHHPRTGELVLDPPQVRVTVRGLERLRVRLGSVLHAVEAVA